MCDNIARHLHNGCERSPLRVDIPQMPQPEKLVGAPIRSIAQPTIDISQHETSLIGVIDLETTGFSHTKDMILEIGIAAVDVLTGEVYSLFESCCREPELGTVSPDAWIFQNSELSYAEVAEAPTLEEIRPKIQETLHITAANTAFNKKFDFGFLRARDFDLGAELPCPMIESTNVVCAPHKSGRGGYKWPTVEEAWEFYFPDQPYVELHRGLDDALHEARILYEMVRRGIIYIGGL